MKSLLSARPLEINFLTDIIFYHRDDHLERLHGIDGMGRVGGDDKCLACFLCVWRAADDNLHPSVDDLQYGIRHLIRCLLLMMRHRICQLESWKHL